jgi:hypothetical protein
MILTSQENFIEIKNDKWTIFKIIDAYETKSYCRYGYWRHQSTELLDLVIYKYQKLIKLNESLSFFFNNNTIRINKKNGVYEYFNFIT